MLFGKIAKVFLGDTVDTIIDRVVPDLNARKEAKEKINSALVSAGNQALLAQLEINKVEAANPSIFVSGWRPACGWVCAGGLAYNFIVHPFLVYGLTLYSPEIAPPPAIDLGPLLTLLMGMLGLGGLRTYEKNQGTARQGWKSFLK